jgi:hypothetical protein
MPPVQTGHTPLIGLTDQQVVDFVGHTGRIRRDQSMSGASLFN